MEPLEIILGHGYLYEHPIYKENYDFGDLTIDDAKEFVEEYKKTHSKNIIYIDIDHNAFPTFVYDMVNTSVECSVLNKYEKSIDKISTDGFPICLLFQSQYVEFNKNIHCLSVLFDYAKTSDNNISYIIDYIKQNKIKIKNTFVDNLKFLLKNYESGSYDLFEFIKKGMTVSSDDANEVLKILMS